MNINTYKKVVCSLLVLFLLFGCASIVSKRHYNVSITSSPNLARVEVRDETGNTIHEGTTPTSVTLGTKRGYFKGKNYIVKFYLEGYQPYEVAIKRSLDGWYVFGNFVFGGLIGWLIVDPLTGAMWKLPKEVVAEFEAADKVALSAGLLNIVTLEDLPSHYQNQLIPVR